MASMLQECADLLAAERYKLEHKQRQFGFATGHLATSRMAARVRNERRQLGEARQHAHVAAAAGSTRSAYDWRNGSRTSSFSATRGPHDAYHGTQMFAMPAMHSTHWNRTAMMPPRVGSAYHQRRLPSVFAGGAPRIRRRWTQESYFDTRAPGSHWDAMASSQHDVDHSFMQQQQHHHHHHAPAPEHAPDGSFMAPTPMSDTLHMDSGWQAPPHHAEEPWQGNSHRPRRGDEEGRAEAEEAEAERRRSPSPSWLQQQPQPASPPLPAQRNGPPLHEHSAGGDTAKAHLLRGRRHSRHRRGRSRDDSRTQPQPQPQPQGEEGESMWRPPRLDGASPPFGDEGGEGDTQRAEAAGLPHHGAPVASHPGHHHHQSQPQSRRPPAASPAPDFPAQRRQFQQSQPIRLGQAGPGAAEQPEEFASTEISLCACKICGRKFAAERLAKHEAACAKATQKKRQAFNIKEKRMTEEQKKADKTSGEVKPKLQPTSGRRKPKWKQQSEQFQAMLKQGEQLHALALASVSLLHARAPVHAALLCVCLLLEVAQAHEGVRVGHAGRRDKQLLAQGVKRSELPPPEYLSEGQEAVVDDRVQCVHCGRCFNQAVHDRHVVHCENMKHRPSRLTRGSGVGGGRGRQR
jgi:hypothetical protein